MINIDVDYYKALFGFEEKISIDLSEDFWLEGEKVTSEQNLFLETEFTESEVKDAVFGSYAEGAPRPDGFSFLFYQHFSELIKKNLVLMFDDWNKSELDLFRLNFS
jgi:hypothetical protein